MSRVHYARSGKSGAACGARAKRLTTNHRRVTCERCLKIIINMGLEAEGIRRKLEHERAKR